MWRKLTSDLGQSHDAGAAKPQYVLLLTSVARYTDFSVLYRKKDWLTYIQIFLMYTANSANTKEKRMISTIATERSVNTYSAGK